MTIDWTIKLTDVAVVFAALLSPLIAVQVTEWIRKKQESRNRKIHIFRTLMSTRAATLVPSHVEALNLAEIEFDIKDKKEKRIVEAWKLYHSHLFDHNYQLDSWGNRKAELLVDMLYEMATYLGYPFDKAHIKSSSYYPIGYAETDGEQHRLRKALLEALEGGALKIQAPKERTQQADEANRYG